MTFPTVHNPASIWWWVPFVLSLAFLADAHHLSLLKSVPRRAYYELAMIPTLFVWVVYALLCILFS